MDERLPSGIDKVPLLNGWLQYGDERLLSAIDKVPLMSYLTVENDSIALRARIKEKRARGQKATEES